MKTYSRFLAASLAVVLGLNGLVVSTYAATLPPGFLEKRLTGSLSSATNMTVAPDGRIFVLEKAGRVRIIKNDTLLSTPFLTLAPAVEGGRGLLGLAFDPGFNGTTNRDIYIYYTAKTPTVHNRVSRFRSSSTNKDVVESGSERILLELPTLGGTEHNGGDLNFFASDKLYVLTGDNQVGTNAASLGTTLGKILRINRDGSIPSDNPFYTTAMGINRAIHATGLRDPSKLARRGRPGGWGYFWFTEAAGTVNEFNRGLDYGNAALDYGWPGCEGASCGPNVSTPLFSYPRPSGCKITGGAWYVPEHVVFGQEYEDKFFYADSCGGYIKLLDELGSPVSDFATGIAGPLDLEVDNLGRLYYLTSSSVYRIYRDTPCTANPSILEQPKSQTVPHNTPVTFTVKASSPPGCALFYQWFEYVGVDGSAEDIPGATGPSLTINARFSNDRDENRFGVTVWNATGYLTSQLAYLTVTLPPELTREAESLTRTSSGASTSIQNDANASGGKWVSLNADGIGDYMEFTTPVLPADRYVLRMKYKMNGNRGIMEVYVDGVLVTSPEYPIDQYSPQVQYRDDYIGSIPFSPAGTHKVRVRCVGRNPEADAYTLSVDQIVFEPYGD